MVAGVGVGGDDRLAQRHPLEQLRDDEWHTCVRANVVNRNDIRVAERGDGARLAFEALATVAVGHPDSGENFDRHVAAKAGIVSPVDLAHAAGAQHTDDLIGAELRPWGNWHGAAL